MGYADLTFKSGKEEEDFLAWLWGTPFNGLSTDTVMQKDIIWPKVLELFRMQSTPEHSCYKSAPEDLYGDLIAEFSGEPADIAPLEAQMEDARTILRSNVQLGVSKIMRLARLEYPEAMSMAADFYFIPYFFDTEDPLPKVAFRYAVKAVEAGFEGGLGRLAFYYRHGIGTRRSLKQAKKYLELALASSHPGNFRFLALFLGYGDLVEPKPEIARAYTLRAMESDMLAFLVWNRLCSDGVIKITGEPQEIIDAKISNPLFGYAVGRGTLNDLFSKGRKPEKDDLERLRDAIMWIRESAGHNVPAALRMFFIMRNDRDRHSLPDKSTYRVCDVCREALTEMEALNHPEYSDPDLPFSALPLQ